MNSEQADRIRYIVSMFQVINPKDVITPETKIKNTTIERLCEYDMPPYRRIKEWCEKKTLELQGQNQHLEFKKILDQAFETFKGRNEKYGDSWKVLSISSTANLIEMKMNRIARLGTDAKTEDEFIDTINYAVMGILKLKQQGKLL